MSGPSAPGRLPPQVAARITRQITALAIGVGVILAIGKFWVWQASGSMGVLSSLVHSVMDLFGALSSFIAVRYAARPPNAQYRFGHGKVESFAAVFQTCLIVFAAFHLLELAGSRLVNPQAIIHSGFVLSILAVFVCLSLWLLLMQSWAIRTTGSLAVRGDRAHYFADMLTNVAVIAGVGLSSLTPFAKADALVGMIIALWLLWTAFNIARLAWGHLVDRELPEPVREHIRTLALSETQVKAVHDLRSRASGPHIHIQMRLDLNDQLTLAQAHDVVLIVEKRLMEAYQAADILIYPHPENCHHQHGNIRFKS